MKKNPLSSNRPKKLLFPINRLLWYEVYRPEGQQRHNRFDRYIGIEHLRHGRSADDAREGDQRKEHAIHGNGDGIGDEDPAPLRSILADACGPQMIDVRINEFGDDHSYDGAEHDPELERKESLPPCAALCGVDDAKEELPGRLPAGLRPAGLCRQYHNELEIERGNEIDRGSHPYSGDSSLRPELLVDQITPGEGEGVDESRIHHERAKIGHLCGRDVAGKGKKEIEPAEYYDGLGLVYIEYRLSFADCSASCPEV